jgi:hypothetical protein
MPLGDRHIVDGSLLDHQVAEFCRHVRAFVVDTGENTIIRPPPAWPNCAAARRDVPRARRPGALAFRSPYR